MNKMAFAFTVTLALVACSQKPAEAPLASDIVEPAAIPVEDVTVQTATPPTTMAFHKELELQGIKFEVHASNSGSLNTLTITPAGLAEVNEVMNREIDGTVSGAEVADINADGSPEIYIWVNSAGSGSYATPIGYSANNNRSLSEIYFPPISDDQLHSKGYMGHDQFTVAENTIAQRFPIYAEKDSNAQPSGKMRQLQYKLTQGEAGWVMKLDTVSEF